MLSPHCFFSVSPLIFRKAILLKNVGALLSCEESIRKLFCFVVKNFVFPFLTSTAFQSRTHQCSI